MALYVYQKLTARAFLSQPWLLLVQKILDRQMLFQLAGYGATPLAPLMIQ
jgi:hypothetical protein